MSAVPGAAWTMVEAALRHGLDSMPAPCAGDIVSARGAVEETVTESARMVDGASEPSPARVAAWIGARNFNRWADLRRFIDSHYPGVFDVEWLFGGKKHGWALRFKKSKSFCTLIPERGRFKVLVVFGAAEREKASVMLARLVSHVREDYEGSTTYPDGKWMVTTVDSVKALEDVKRLLEVKRRPKTGKAQAPAT